VSFQLQLPSLFLPSRTFFRTSLTPLSIVHSLVAPNPRKKTTRVLKFDIPPPSSSPVPSRPSSVPPPLPTSIPTPTAEEGEEKESSLLDSLAEGVVKPVRKAVGLE